MLYDVVVVCFVNSMVTWVWPWGQFHWSEPESLLGMSMSRGLFGMFLSGGSPGSGGLLFMSMFMGLLRMSVSGGLVGMSVSGGLIGMSVSGGLSSRFTICVSWVASFECVIVVCHCFIKVYVYVWCHSAFCYYMFLCLLVLFAPSAGKIWVCRFHVFSYF